ncbi:alpha-soluble NSF attachment protein [Nematocida displodere]|uniref:Gamma-soluble NSF attachment protein n=1 Tax=Nematocida displodere TaxID=1805483 RepID=A0A177EMH0_9MICR|nr:alpha-soluble NSF attachment protein [Nematocida displodere]
MTSRLSPEELERKADAYYKRMNNFILNWFSSIDLTQAADFYIQAAQAYCNTSNYCKSAELFYRAGEILLQENKEESMYEASSAFVKSAESFYIIDKEKSARAYAKSFEIASHRVGDFSMAAILAVKTAKIYREIKEEKEALSYLYKATELYGNAQMKVNRRNIISMCAELEMRQKNYEQAFHLYKDLILDDSNISQIIEKTTHQFSAILCGIILGKTKECTEILNDMEESKTETKIALHMISIKTGREADHEGLETEIAYLRRTSKIAPEIGLALQDVQMSIDPDNDIL